MSNDELDYFGVERWAPVPGLECCCEVSTLGRVRGVSGRILKPVAHHNGYRRLVLYCKHEKRKVTWRLHRLVATAFVPNPYCMPEVHHLDHNIKNNGVMNLEWCDRQTNIDYRYAEDRDECTRYPDGYYSGVESDVHV